MPSPVPSNEMRCSHTTRTGKRCRAEHMPEESLCFQHWSAARRRDEVTARKERAMINNYYAAATILRKGDRFDTAEGVNKLLARVLTGVAEGRIEPKMASSIGYLGQVLLTSTPQIARDRAAAAAAGAEQQHPIFTNDQLSFVNQFMKALDECAANEAENEPPESTYPGFSSEHTSPNTEPNADADQCAVATQQETPDATSHKSPVSSHA